MISTSHRWRKTALASLVAAAFGLYGSNASALALGRITVQSALGDPLRAEIDVPEINADEAASLRPGVASPEAFRAAGLEFNPALAGIQISLQRRPDGRAYLRLTSERPVSEPFVDLILEATWASGRLVRDYTLLLDPPSLRATLPPQPAPPQTAPAQVAVAPATPAPAATSRQASAPAAAARPAAIPPAARTPAPSAATAPAAPGGSTLVVQRGDTAGKIASTNKAPQVSLDQMLVALLRNNESAFINGNLNRLKAGAVLNLPSQEQALSVGNAEARSIVVAHSRDFNDFRNQLATNAPTQQVAAANRSAGGNVQAQVQDGKAATPAPDRLTLSQGGVQGQQAAAVAQSRAAQDNAQRAAELARNVQDLAKLSAASAAAAPPAAVAPATSSPAAAVAAMPAPAASAEAPAAPTPVAAPAAPPVVAAPKPPAPPPQPAAVEEESLLDSLLANPMLLAAGGGLIALLAGLGFYKGYKRRKTADVDSAFLESRLQPDSFFGASGGQRVDTADAAPTGSSMVYSPSQLDAADDVDPVAEADVYLAYGRDAQAEEILREALRTHPGRIAVHQKLLDIYAKRRDAASFEAVATEAYKLAGDGTQEWQHICEQGRSIDPTNALYQPGGQPAPGSATGASAIAPMAMATATVPMGAASIATLKMPAVPSVAPTSVDLDLDFSLDDLEAPSAIEEAKPSQLEPTIAISPPSSADSANAPLDFDFGVATEPISPPASATAPMPVEVNLPDISKADDTLALVNRESDDFRQQAEVAFGSTSPLPLQMSNGGTRANAGAVDAPLPDVSFGYTAPSELTATQAPLNTPPAAADSGMLEFDLGTLSLELDDPSAHAVTANGDLEPESDDPLATKLALAEEFVSIGDDDGARALIEEVIAEATGELQARAQRALASLS